MRTNADLTVLLDLRMPKVDGFQVLAEMRADEEAALRAFPDDDNEQQQRGKRSGPGI